MHFPLVSVIMPLFNAAPFVEETIQSVLKQTYPSIELIIVNDHSTDDSYARALKYRSKKVIVNHNIGKGACSARNYGFQLCKGRYIQYLDADDILSPNKIKYQVEAMTSLPGQLSVCNTFHFKNNTELGICYDRPYVFSTSKPEDLFINLWGGNHLPMHMITVSAWLSPRNLIESAGPWNEDLAKDQDGEFFARVGLNSSGIIYVPEVKFFYRKHLTGENIGSKKQRKHIESILMATELKSSYLINKIESLAAKRAVATLYKHVAIEAWPQEKDIYDKAISKCKEYGGSYYNPKLGGHLIELIKKVFGWRIAKSISYYGHQIFKK
ncbi:Glycosyl transferase family 2 [Flavobacteriaceae bacterium MAR_2010_188]|nr:Glycosyl transferase family 2 [Flavobacteriaceae bacterium MAR_2010_188]